MKTLEVIIPVYGKDPKSTYDNLSKLSVVNDVRIHFTIVYKNSDKFNYDLLNKLNSDLINVIKGNPEYKKTRKVLLGIEKSESKYLFVMDAHHELKISNISNLLNELEKNDANIFRTIPTFNNVDNNKSRRHYANAFNAGRHIIKRETLINDENYINYDIIYYDDWTYGLYSLFRSNKKIKYIFVDYYIINFGSKISNTRNQDDKETSLKIAEDASEMVRFYIENELFSINKNSRIFLKNFFKMFKGAFEMYCKASGVKSSKATKEERALIFEKILKTNVDEKLKIIYKLKRSQFNPFYKIDYHIIKKIDIK